MDVPQDTPSHLLQARPHVQVVVVAEHTSETGKVMPVEPPQEHGGIPHGGEPNVRAIRAALFTTSSTSGHVVIMHQPWRDLESDDIAEHLRPMIGWNALVEDGNVKSTEGITPKQHKERNAKLPPKARVLGSS